MGLKVLLVGINAYATMPLNGCVNDVVSVRQYLLQQHGVADEQVRLLTDAQGTRQAIVDGISWLLEPDGDGLPATRLFQFSGHGTFIPDEDGDELDGQDEALVPYDFQSAGMLTDDMLSQLYGRFSPETRLLLTMDCCHSGTIQKAISFDRRERFLPNSPEQIQRIAELKKTQEQRRQAYLSQLQRQPRSLQTPQDEWEARIKAAMAQYDQQHFGQVEQQGNSILLSACRADQTAADARFGQSFNGALTFYMLEALRESGGRISYSALVEQVGRNLEANKFLQIPQLECSSANRESLYLALEPS